MTEYRSGDYPNQPIAAGVETTTWRDVVERCGKQFRSYQQHYVDTGDTEKAHVNAHYAEMCEKLLRDGIPS
jgi:hypothetical protein